MIFDLLIRAKTFFFLLNDLNVVLVVGMRTSGTPPTMSLSTFPLPRRSPKSSIMATTRARTTRWQHKPASPRHQAAGQRGGAIWTTLHLLTDPGPTVPTLTTGIPTLRSGGDSTTETTDTIPAIIKIGCALGATEILGTHPTRRIGIGVSREESRIHRFPPSSSSGRVADSLEEGKANKIAEENSGIRWTVIAGKT